MHLSVQPSLVACPGRRLGDDGRLDQPGRRDGPARGAARHGRGDAARIAAGEIDAIVMDGAQGERRVYTLENEERPYGTGKPMIAKFGG